MGIVRRRDVVSRWALGFAMIVACGLLVRAATDDTPVPTGSSLVARAPYLQRTSPTGTVVRWRTAQPMVGTIYFGATWGDLVNTGTRLLRPGLSYEHELEIDGLTPGTRYYYAIASGASILAGNDAEHFFETHPVPGPPRNTRIWVLGDSGFEGPKQEAVRDSYYAFAGSRHTDLWLHVGDVSQSQGTDEQYQAEFFDGYVEMMRKSALLPTLGNHDGVNSDTDTLSGPYYENFTMPSAGEAGGMASGTEGYYSFDYANMHFIVLDSQDSDRSPGSDMLTWLQLDLEATDADWIIAYWHHPPYTHGHHDSDVPNDSGGRLFDMRQNVLPILDDFGADLVLSGHSHSYERSFLLDGHYGTSDTLVESMKVDDGDGRESGDGAYLKLPRGAVPYPGPGDGAVYVVPGSSSANWGGALNHPVMVESINKVGSLVLDVDGLRLDGRFLDGTCTESPCPGSILDSFTIVKDCPAGDVDEDGICDDRDNCLGVANPVQTDTDDDGIGDACDPDNDNDGVDDVFDCAPFTPGIASPPAPVGPTLFLDRFGGTTLYWDRAPQGPVSNVYRVLVESGSPPADPACLTWTTWDTLQSPQPPPANQLFFYLISAENICGAAALGPGNSRSPAILCVPDPDADFDFDTVPDLADNCAQWPDQSQLDSDKDFVGNVCDNCTSVFNPNQADCNDDGQGDACDTNSDCDGDGVSDAGDNCPVVSNPLQEDNDDDQAGDACDADDDNDGVEDGADPAPLDPSLCGDADADTCDDCSVGTDGIGPLPDFNTANDGPDFDADGQCDAGDPDDDNDGVADESDCAPFSRGVAASPDPVGSTLRLSRGGNIQLTWLRSFQGHTANVYSGTADSSTPWNYDLWCASAELTVTEFDPSGGASNVLTYYLIGARNSCGDSVAGLDSLGEPVPLEEICEAQVRDGDGDGILDVADNCPEASNLDQLDTDGDFVGEACDNCAAMFNPDQADSDSDTIGDVCDLD